MTIIYDWPSSLGFQGVSFDPRGMTAAGPTSLTGRSQVASIDAGYWVAALGEMPVADPTKVKLYRAFRALLEGGAHQIRVPVCDGAQAPWPLAGSGAPVTSMAPVKFSDLALFSDGSGFYQPVIAAETVGAAAARATSVVIDATYVGDVIGGELFSIGDRLHVIRSILLESGTQLTVAFWPPLREDVPDGTPVNFDRPVCRMRLADEGSGDLALQFGRYGSPAMTFVEAF